MRDHVQDCEWNDVTVKLGPACPPARVRPSTACQESGSYSASSPWRQPQLASSARYLSQDHLNGIATAFMAAGGHPVALNDELMAAKGSGLGVAHALAGHLVDSLSEAVNSEAREMFLGRCWFILQDVVTAQAS